MPHIKFVPYLVLLIFLLGCSPDEMKDRNEAGLALNDPNITQIDSLILTDIKLPEVINYLEFDTATIAVFHHLADQTNGKLYLAANANLVVETIIEVIENQGDDEIDLCFLIDKTGSMMDDIFLMQQSLERIFAAIKAYKYVNVAISYYGDKNVDGKNWLEINEFSQDFDKLEKDFKDVIYSGGGDAPESVTDAAFEVINQLNWTSTKKRIILLLGDAPSLLPPLAKHSVEDVIAEAKSKDILMNYYPVVVGFAGIKAGPVEENLIASIYPNPSQGIVNILFEKEEPYLVEVFNSSGKSISTLHTNSKKHQVDLSEQPNGVYIVRVLTKFNSAVDTRKIILQK